eukprot:COSAG02_NODE_4761_length_5016_cov_3.037014_4_plen_92_part_00
MQSTSPGKTQDVLTLLLALGGQAPMPVRKLADCPDVWLLEFAFKRVPASLRGAGTRGHTSIDSVRDWHVPTYHLSKLSFHFDNTPHNCSYT